MRSIAWHTPKFNFKNRSVILSTSAFENRFYFNTMEQSNSISKIEVHSISCLHSFKLENEHGQWCSKKMPCRHATDPLGKGVKSEIFATYLFFPNINLFTGKIFFFLLIFLRDMLISLKFYPEEKIANNSCRAQGTRNF